MPLSLVALLALLPPAGDPSIDSFLKSVKAKLTVNSADGEQAFGRPARGYESPMEWALVKGKVGKMLTPSGWTFAAETDFASNACTKGDQEILFWPNPGHGTEIYVQRNPDWVRSLRNRRCQFLWDVSVADEDFAELAGEGWANEILFPAGDGDKLYYISGDYFESVPRRGELFLSAYGRIAGKPAKLWSSIITKIPKDQDASRPAGTLAKYLLADGTEIANPSSEALADLSQICALSYQSENHGDGGTDLGYIEPNGIAKIARCRPISNATISLEEERYVKFLAFK